MNIDKVTGTNYVQKGTVEMAKEFNREQVDKALKGNEKPSLKEEGKGSKIDFKA